LEKGKGFTKGAGAAQWRGVCKLDGWMCSGIPKGKKQTYALLEERVPKPPALNRDQSLSELAIRYFTSHGPATIQDFVWWSGLPVRDAKNALESIKKELEPITTNQQTYWMNRSYQKKVLNTNGIFLLPAYDEFIISYKDRTPSIRHENHKKAISDNGLFRPIIVEDGIVLGTWRKTQKKEKVIIETSYFANEFEPTNKVPEQSARNYGDFLQQKTEIVNIDV